MGVISKFMGRREQQRIAEIERSCDISLEYMRYCEACRMEMKTPLSFERWSQP